MKLDLTEFQAQAIMQCVDAAVRAHGIQCVRQAVIALDVFDAAAAAEQAESNSPQEAPK